MKINILTNNSCPNSRAFNDPLLASKPYFTEKGYSLEFRWKISDKVFNCDVLFINSNVFRISWKSESYKIFKFLESARTRNLKILWFDTTDSTWCTQFEVLPYVDRFLKNHIFKEKKVYFQKFRTGRIFTDFFDALYQSGEKTDNYPLPAENHINKLGISWTPCFQQYDENRYSLRRKLLNYTRPYLGEYLPGKLTLDFTPVLKDRPFDISARFGISHSRSSVIAHRKAIVSILAKKNCDCRRIPLKEYFTEMRNAKISVSPFGVGEFCYRDFESIICGTTLLKPDMSHLETWPDFYQNGTTCVFHEWDLADLDEKIDFLLSNTEKRIEIAENAQKVYKDAVSPEGLATFADRLIGIMK